MVSRARGQLLVSRLTGHVVLSKFHLSGKRVNQALLRLRRIEQVKGLVSHKLPRSFQIWRLECLIKRQCREVLLKTADLWSILPAHTNPLLIQGAGHA